MYREVILDMFERSLTESKKYVIPNDYKIISERLLSKSGYIDIGVRTLIHIVLDTSVIIRAPGTIMKSDKKIYHVDAYSDAFEIFDMNIKTEEELFQYSTLVDIGDITFEDVEIYHTLFSDISKIALSKLNEMKQIIRFQSIWDIIK